MEDDDGDEDGEPVVVEITDTLDLHTFAPRDVKALVADYLDLAADKGITRVRIIHGKARGRFAASSTASSRSTRAWRASSSPPTPAPGARPSSACGLDPRRSAPDERLRNEALAEDAAEELGLLAQIPKLQVDR